ncbi:hypothetical protein BY996DRAFT_6866862 [Phakopsora pachyrhizi]|nr:hypothetical protein BY996DRAFT_6866862 [Phakopsora pachyrhizi]
MPCQLLSIGACGITITPVCAALSSTSLLIWFSQPDLPSRGPSSIGGAGLVLPPSTYLFFFIFIYIILL